MKGTWRYSTAYWKTDWIELSLLTTRLAMFLCTKSSPGPQPTISLAGTRASEQPTRERRVRTDYGQYVANLRVRACMRACCPALFLSGGARTHAENSRRWGPRRAAHGENGLMHFSTWEGGCISGRAPIQRNLGDCPLDMRRKKSGSFLVCSLTHWGESKGGKKGGGSAKEARMAAGSAVAACIRGRPRDTHCTPARCRARSASRPPAS